MQSHRNLLSIPFILFISFRNTRMPEGAARRLQSIRSGKHVKPRFTSVSYTCNNIVLVLRTQVTAMPMRQGLRPENRAPSGGVSLRFDGPNAASASVLPMRQPSRQLSGSFPFNVAERMESRHALPSQRQKPVLLTKSLSGAIHLRLAERMESSHAPPIRYRTIHMTYTYLCNLLKGANRPPCHHDEGGAIAGE